jgi:EF-P beta-lysylation protein EpmB
MLARTQSGCQDVRWKRELAQSITRPETLVETLDLDPGLLPAARAASRDFRLLVPSGFAALMERGNPNDPLLRQVLPLADELRNPPGYDVDPVGDRVSVRAPGLLQKYQGRALLLVTGACAIHCRYCFRRHFPYGGSSALPDRATGAVARLAEDPSVTEVILSGGDPLMLDDSAIAELIRSLGAIPRLRYLRLHTRLPIVLPSRVTDGLCAILAESRLKPIVVVQVNHARELGGESRRALASLRNAGAALLNQSVLLRTVNDSEQQLADLSTALIDCSVFPYYLHLLDRVRGSAHFDLEGTKAARIMDRLRARLPGYLVPRLVRETAGQPYKVPVGPPTGGHESVGRIDDGTEVTKGR